MSLYHQPKISIDGLIYTFDATNLRCVPTTASGLRNQSAIRITTATGAYAYHIATDELKYETIVFTGVGSGSFFVSADLPDVDYLIVAGGGGGGSSLGGGAAGGGGGAGGLIEGSFGTLSAGSYNYTVGDGGAGGATAVDDPGDDGQNSAVFGLTAIGGGGGAGRGGSGRNGGSGGGANEPTAGSGTPGQGFGGGTSDNPISPSAGGGGGGAGGAGSNASADFYFAGQGGPGKESSITGTATYYAGGGGGGNGDLPNTGFGGIGGGGDGGDGIDRNVATSRSLPGYDAVDGTGGGGGGGAGTGAGGDGGSGIIVLKYPVISRPYTNISGSPIYNSRFVGDSFSGDKFLYSVPSANNVRNSVVLDNSIVFLDKEPFTLNFWVKLDASANENAYSLAGRFSTTGHIYVDQEGDFDGSEWRLYWRSQGNTTVQISPIITNANIKDTYVNITVSSDENRTVRTYVNGVLVEVDSIPDTTAFTVSTVFGGYRSSTFHLSWYGFAAIAQVYNRTLTDSEVRANYLAYAKRYA